MRVLLLGEAVLPGLVNKLLDELHSLYPITYLADTGNKKGLGFEASGWAFRNDVEMETFTPQWSETNPDKVVGRLEIDVNSWGKPYNKAAGHNRDKLLLEKAQPELLIYSEIKTAESYVFEKVFRTYPSIATITYSPMRNDFQRIRPIDASAITLAPVAPTDLSHYEADALF